MEMSNLEMSPRDLLTFLEKKDDEEVALSEIHSIRGLKGITHVSTGLLESAKELEKEGKVILFQKEGKYYIKKKNQENSYRV